MSDVYYLDRHRSWHLCFTFTDFQDARSFIKDMDKYDRRFLTGLSYWKLDESKEPHVVGTIFEREVNFNYVREKAETYNGKEYKIDDDSWIMKLTDFRKGRPKKKPKLKYFMRNMRFLFSTVSMKRLQNSKSRRQVSPRFWKKFIER